MPAICGHFLWKEKMTEIKVLSTNNAPAAIGPYVQGKIVNGLLFASGQIPLY